MLKYLAVITGPEYGTMEAAWKSVLVEAERRADLHNNVKENLVGNHLLLTF